jgi:hypothetical protein
VTLNVQARSGAMIHRFQVPQTNQCPLKFGHRTDGLEHEPPARSAMGLVVSALLLSVFSAKWMGELHRKQQPCRI